MKSVSVRHAYDAFGNVANTSEKSRIEEINHFMERESFERFKKTPEEKAELATAIQRYPNRNHKPMN